jgi:hypothetical protein
MSQDWDYNWIPKDFGEFQGKVQAGRVQLNIMPEQFGWLYQHALAKPMFGKYEAKLLEAMTRDEKLFRRVHEFGVDLVLRS